MSSETSKPYVLVIVESATKARQIQNYLGSNFTVKASSGHIRDLPKKDLGIDLNTFRPTYVIQDSKKNIVADLKNLLQNASHTILATDPDREGEAIAWHLKEVLRLSDGTYNRVKFNEITPAAIQLAMQTQATAKISMPDVVAQEARRLIDRMVGYSLSGKLTNLLSNKMPGELFTVGRVQSPVLSLVCQRDKQIIEFKETNHFGVRVACANDGATPEWFADWQPDADEGCFLNDDESYVLDQNLANAVARAKQFELISYGVSDSVSAPPPPFITSTLQQAAQVSFKLSPTQTMAIAQHLFELGLITYMRTDNPNLSAAIVPDLHQAARQHFMLADEVLASNHRSFKTPKGAQEAHEGIRPTDFNIAANASLAQRGVTGNEKAGYTLQDCEQLYQLIYLRAMASQLEDAVSDKVEVRLRSEPVNGIHPIFKASSKKPRFLGWRELYRVHGAKVDPDATEKEGENADDLVDQHSIPAMREGALIQGQCKVIPKKTKPPKRYTLASLISKMEAVGIGRPSTYATTITTLLNRKSISADKNNQVKSTDKGMLSYEAMLNRSQFIAIDYTAALEETLDGISARTTPYLQTMQDVLTVIQQEMELLDQDYQRQIVHCAKCDGELSRRVSKFDQKTHYWICRQESCRTMFEDQNGTVGTLIVPPQKTQTDIECPHCHATKLIHQKGVTKAKEGVPSKPYEMWLCSDKDCASRFFADEHGQPKLNQSKKGGSTSDFSCHSCGSGMAHFYSQENGYNYYKCSKTTCSEHKVPMQLVEGRLIPQGAKLTDFDCQYCAGKIVQHTGPAEYHNFYQCEHAVKDQNTIKHHPNPCPLKHPKLELLNGALVPMMQTHNRCAVCDNQLVAVYNISNKNNDRRQSGYKFVCITPSTADHITDGQQNIPYTQLEDDFLWTNPLNAQRFKSKKK